MDFYAIQNKFIIIIIIIIIIIFLKEVINEFSTKNMLPVMPTKVKHNSLYISALKYQYT